MVLSFQLLEKKKTLIKQKIILLKVVKNIRSDSEYLFSCEMYGVSFARAKFHKIPG